MSDNPFRNLPSVDVLADQIEVDLPKALLVDVARVSLTEARKQIGDGNSSNLLETAQRLARALKRSAGVGVINASGVLLHTNLGRARWSQTAIQRATEAARFTTNLEMDLETGSRSRRGGYVNKLLSSLTGADDALVVNNNASAVVLALAATASGRSSVVARGEQIEIGGSYRLPDVMKASGTTMVEVGTTNRTRVGDYETALQLHDVGAILKIHPSNYRVVGFTEEADVSELAGLETEAVLIHDIGSGLLDHDASWVPDWLGDEPGAKQSIADGADLVMFSGDKLLGGPQAGILVGSQEIIDLLRSHALARALRVDGVTYAALGATLEAYLDGRPDAIPFWRQALLSMESLEERARHFATAVDGSVEAGSSAVGGGSAPGAEIPSPLVRVSGRDDLFEKLLDHDTPVLTRRDDGDLVVDLRAVDTDQDQPSIDAILKCR